MNALCCKVGESIQSHDLDSGVREEDTNEHLVARWVGSDDYTEEGYRTLAKWFNKRIMHDVYLEAGRSVSETRIDADYAALTDDERAVREDIADDLRVDGVDVDALEADFVSRATMRRHLTNCLGAEKERKPATSDWELDKIEHGRTHFRKSVTSAVRSLANKNKLPGGTDAEVETPIILSCPECTARTRLETALSRGYVCREHLGNVSKGKNNEETNRAPVGPDASE
ncbi:MAG: rod-determining factor RdfA [Natronomonas sp.]